MDVSGLIEDRTYIVSFYGLPYAIPTVEIANDRNGPYALIEETLRRFSDGFELRVDLEPDEDGYHGCAISFSRRDDEPVEKLALQQGINPNAVNLLIPAKQVVAICFDFAGKVDGCVGGALSLISKE